MAWREKTTEWLHRYGVAEIAGVVAALAGSWSVHALTGSDLLTAYGGAIGENLGYYGIIVGRDVVRDRRATRARGRVYGVRGALLTTRNLLFEFGIAELIDTGFLRPLAMGLGMRFFGQSTGIVVGKLVADVAFYVPVLCAYELRRRFARAAAGD